MFKILIPLIIYSVFIYIISYRKKINKDDYYKINQKVPIIVLAFSVFATLLSPISFLTLIDNSYIGNYHLWFAQCGIFLAIPLAHRYFLPLYSKKDYKTAYHILEDKFKSPHIRSLASGLFIIYQLGRIAVITYLLTEALKPFISINQILLSGLLLFFTVYYLAKGGILVVLWTDFFQGLIIILVLSLFIPKIINFKITPNSHQTLFQMTKKIDLINIIILIIGAGLSTLFTYISSQDIVQRFNTKIKNNNIKKTLWSQGTLSLIIATSLYLIGFLIKKNHFVNNSNHPVIISYTTNKLSTWFSGLLVLALLAAAQSTISSSINAIVTCFKFDFDHSKLRLSPKVMSFITAFISWLICIILVNSQIYSIYEWINGFMGMTLGVIGGLYIIILIVKKPSLNMAKIYLILSLGSLIVYNYTDTFTKPNPWLNSIIASFIAISISATYKAIQSSPKRKKNKHAKISNTINKPKELLKNKR